MRLDVGTYSYYLMFCLFVLFCVFFVIDVSLCFIFYIFFIARSTGGELWNLQFGQCRWCRLVGGRGGLERAIGAWFGRSSGGGQGGGEVR